ncbi:MAG: glycine-rich domain-containing protein-like, partial [Pseudomonadota bacterium]
MQKEKDLASIQCYLQKIDLQPVVERLVRLEHWALNEAKDAVQQYRNYLFLKLKYPEKKLPPSKDIDDVWHAHILHTKAYRDFCEEIAPYSNMPFLDHWPQLPHSAADNTLVQLFAETQNLYQKEFGEYLYQVRPTGFWRFWARLQVGIK